MSKVLLGAMFASASMAAHAACTDPAAQFVNWSGCDKTALGTEKATKFYGGVFYRTNFTAARLDFAQFGSAQLAEANFTNAVLIGANFSNANLIGVNFTGAEVRGANFANANLTLATWIDGTRCEGTTLGLCHPNQALTKY